MKKEEIIVMTNIRELYNNLIVKLQEFTYTIGASKRIQVMSEYIDVRPGDSLEIDPDTPRGKRLKFCETLFHTRAKLYQPSQLSKNLKEHHLQVLSTDSTSIGYFLTAVKNNNNKPKAN
jgi:hypothetical protein